MRAADVIVKCLEAYGIERVYCVPGESYLALLDALYDSTIKIIVCRHEAGAGFMAVAEAKLTGKPGVVMVSRGPGATNLSIALHTAQQDAAPVLALVGQVSRVERGRGAFQEMDYQQFFGGIAKSVVEVSHGGMMGETVRRALHISQSGTPGPVVISLPEDVLDDESDDHTASPMAAVKVSHHAQAIDDIAVLIAQAERPLLVAGGLLRGVKGAATLQRFAEAQRVPVAVTWKNQDIFDNSSNLYAGHLGFGNPPSHREVLAQCDLIIAVGTRLGDVASLNYSFPQAPQPSQKLVHVYPDADVIGRVFATDYGLVADPVAVLAELGQRPRVVSSAREAWCSSVNGYIKTFQSFTSPEPQDGVDFGKVIMALMRHAPQDAILTTDSGNATSWLHRHWIMTPHNILLGAIAGAMGFGVPSVTAAGFVHPQRMAITIVGDGSILMTGQELATALQYGARPKIVISDNGTYGTIRTHQERHYPQRVSGTDLVNPDFSQWAAAFGAKVFTLSLGDDVEVTVKAFLAETDASVLHVKSSREAISAFTTLKAFGQNL